MKKGFAILFILFMFSYNLIGEGKKVSGVVCSADDNTILSGVSVIVAFFMLNIADGGNRVVVQGVDTSIFPQTKEVHYVKVYQETI